jgi:hypothetical protein
MVAAVQMIPNGKSSLVDAVFGKRVHSHHDAHFHRRRDHAIGSSDFNIDCQE